MLYKIDKNGFVVNEANPKKVQPYYKKILVEISKLYNEKLGDNLISIYIRGSVSVGKAKPRISDIDSVAVTKKELPREELFWIIKASKRLEKKYPKAGFFDLTVVSLEELKNAENYKNLRVYLKTQSFLLSGQDVLSQLPDIIPGKELALQLYGDLLEELEILKNIFAGKIKDREYLFQKRPTEFWCIWTTRVLLRAGLGVVMTKRPVYSQDLKTCYAVFTKEYPQYKKEMKQLLIWSIEPISNKKKVFAFLNNFAPKFLELWQQNIKNN